MVAGGPELGGPLREFGVSIYYRRLRAATMGVAKKPGAE